MNRAHAPVRCITRPLRAEGEHPVRGRPCTAGRLLGRAAMLREFSATPVGAARREAR